jgi:signal transduction histidine kinase
VNLEMNALEAMPQGGTLRIVLTCKENTNAVIRISDTGVGIPRGQESKIFDPFFTTKEQGTGLGLSIVHSIARSHGGKISFMNNEGGGTTFVLTLPLHKGIMGCFGAVGPVGAGEKGESV